MRLGSFAGINAASFVIITIVLVAWNYILVEVCASEIASVVLLFGAAVSLLALLDLGLSLYAIQIISGDLRPAARRDFIVHGLLWVCGAPIALAASSPVVVHVFQLTGGLQYLVWLVFLAALSQNGQLFLIGVLKGGMQLRTAAMLQILGAVLQYVPASVFLIRGGDALVAAVAMTLGLVVSLLVGWLVVRRLGAVKLGVVSPDTGAGAADVVPFRRHVAKSIHYLPQMLAGVFFQGALRVSAMVGTGVDAVPVINAGYTAMARIHGLFNSVYELVFPSFHRFPSWYAAATSRRATLAALIAYSLILGLAAIVVGALLPKRGWEVSTVMLSFGFGIWCSILLSPRFHALNAAGRALVSSGLSFLGIVFFLIGFVIALAGIGHLPLWWYGVMYSLGNFAVYLVGRMVRMPSARVVEDGGR